MTLYKMFVLLGLFNLSDEELEFLVNDRSFFEEFVGFGVMNAILRATSHYGGFFQGAAPVI